jgi:hypothetical protein
VGKKATVLNYANTPTALYCSAIPPFSLFRFHCRLK